MRAVLLAMVMALILAAASLFWLRETTAEPADVQEPRATDVLTLHRNGEVDLNGAPLTAFSADQYLWKDTRASGAQLITELQAIQPSESALTFRVDELALVGWYLRLFDAVGGAQSTPGQPELWQDLFLQIGQDRRPIPDQRTLESYPLLRMDLFGGADYRLQLSPETLDISTVLNSDRLGFLTMIYCPLDWPLQKGRALAKQVLGPQAEIRLPMQLGLSQE